METLNYHHLRYFREVANDGNLTRTAARLNLSQSALSSQIRELEARLGHKLFERTGRRLILTEVGRIALDHADRIFNTGHELLATLQRTGGKTPPLRIGALSTLSRNFQIRFLQPVLSRADTSLQLLSGDASMLYRALAELSLDVLLTTEPPHQSTDQGFVTHRLADQPYGLHGQPALLHYETLRSLLSEAPLIVPTGQSVRAGFDSLVARLDLEPQIVADVDDMAMVRLLARAGAGIAVAPAVVLADEIAAGTLATAPFELGISEVFYAVTAKRNFPHPAVQSLIQAARV